MSNNLNITGDDAPEPNRRDHEERHTDTRSDSAPGHDPSRRREAAGSRVLRLLASSHRAPVTPEIKEYTDRLQTVLSESLTGSKITVKPLVPVPSVYVVRAWKGDIEYAYLIGFTSMMTRSESPYQPADQKLLTAADILSSNNSKIKLVNAMLVSASDIAARGDLIVSMIQQAIEQEMYPEEYELTLRGLSVDTTLDILSSDVEQARNYIRRYSSSVIDPRMDMGFITSIKVPEDVYRVMTEEDKAIVDTNDLRENSMPVSAVAAYVDFIGPERFTDPRGNEVEQFIPRISVTAQASFIDSPLFTLMNIMTIKRVWIEGNGWMDHFLTQPSGGVNIANLTEDEEGRVLDMSPEDFLGNYSRYFAKPIITFDVSVGRHTSKFLNTLANSDGETTRKLVDVIERVLNDDKGNFGADLSSMRDFERMSLSVGREFQGYINDRGRQRDSRYLDFLSEVKKGKLDPDVRRELMNNHMTDKDPVRHLEILEPLFSGPSNYESLFDTDIVMITPQFLSALEAAFEREDVRIIDRDNGRRRRSISGASSAASLSGYGIDGRGSRVFSGSSRGGRRTNGSWYSPFGR